MPTFYRTAELWYYVVGSVLLCPRFPTLPKWSAVAPDPHGGINNRRSFLVLFLTMLLLTFAAWQEGVAAMLSAVAVEVAVHFAIVVGSRVERRT
jgi:hypothetical protein